MTDGPFRLDGKVAVVTGAGQGIGRAIALALADAGAAVAVTGLPERRADLDAVREEISAAGGTASAFELDVASTSSISSAFDRMVAVLGRVDVLVNNAGIRAGGPSLEVTESDWDRVLAVNLRGTFFCSQAAARHMIENGGGRIVNIASQLVVSAAPERAAYIASKGGIVALTKTLAVEWARNGMTVNAIGPGPTDTPMTADSDQATATRLAARSPIGRRLKPDEIAGAVVFLAGPAAAAITGQLLMVDGGWTAG